MYDEHKTNGKSVQPEIYIQKFSRWCNPRSNRWVTGTLQDVLQLVWAEVRSQNRNHLEHAVPHCAHQLEIGHVSGQIQIFRNCCRKLFVCLPSKKDIAQDMWKFAFHSRRRRRQNGQGSIFVQLNWLWLSWFVIMDDEVPLPDVSHTDVCLQVSDEILFGHVDVCLVICIALTHDDINLQVEQLLHNSGSCMQ